MPQLLLLLLYVPAEECVLESPIVSTLAGRNLVAIENHSPNESTNMDNAADQEQWLEFFRNSNLQKSTRCCSFFALILPFNELIFN